MPGLALAVVLAAGCDCGAREPRPSPEEQAPAEIPEPDETDAPDADVHMREHDVVARRARDAVIGGRPEEARQGLSWLAGHTYPETLPPSLRGYATRMQAAAAAAKDATRLAEAARSMGSLAATCGACHEHVEGGPKREPSGFEEVVDQDLPERMHRHAWAVERLWDGLITPWEESWRVGAEVLAEGRFGIDAQRTYSDAVRSDLERVQALGRKATEQRAWDERAAVYGELLTTCASCHRRLGVALDRR